MAITYDGNAAGAATNGTTSQAVSITVPSGATALFAAIVGDTNSDLITGVTWNDGVTNPALTLVDKITGGGGFNERWTYLYWIGSPVSGTHNLTATASGSIYIGIVGASYSGSVTTQPTNFANNKTASGTTLTTSLTVASANSWLIGANKCTSGSIVAGTGTTLRADDGFGGVGIAGDCDSNGGLSAGSQSLQVTHSGAAEMALVICELVEASTGTPITGPTIASGASLTAPSLAVGSVTITGPTIASGASLNQPTLGQVVHIEASFAGGTYGRIATVTATAASLVLSTPVTKRIFQRSSGVADIPMTGTLNSVSWSGTLSAQAQGQGTLTARVEENTAITASVADIGIGELFPFGGDSRALGKGDNAQSFSHATLKAMVFNKTDGWALCNDPIDTGDTGSHWPLLATYLMASLGVPVGFISFGVGSTDVFGTGSDTWKSGGSDYLALIQQVTDSGVNAVKAVLMMLGPNAIVNGTTPSAANYNTAVDGMANGFAGAMAGAPVTLIDLCGEVATGSPPDRRAAEDNVRQAIRTAVSDNANVKLGPVLLDQDYVDDVHPSTDAQLLVVAKRWFVALDRAFYGGTARPPRPSLIVLTDTTHITITYDQTLSNTNGAAMSGFIVEDDGTPLTVSSATVVAPNQVVLVVTPAVAGIPTVTWGSNDDVKGLATIPLVTATLPDASTVSLSPEPLLDNGVTLTIAGPTKASTAVLNQPTLTVGAVTITMPTIASAAQLFRPRLSGVGVSGPSTGSRARNRSRAR